MTAHETTPPDAAIAQAFRERRPSAEHSDTQCLMEDIWNRAREIEQRLELPTELSREQAMSIRDSVQPGDGWDGDDWDYALIEAAYEYARLACRRMGNGDE